MVNTQLKILRVFGPTGAEVSSVLRGIRDDGCPGLRLLERDGEFAICVQVSAPNRAMAEQYCEKWAARLRTKFGDDVFAEGETSLAQATLDALLEKRKLLVAVDETTGRLLGALLPVASAAKSEATEAAETLYGLGLFQGTGTDAAGRPNYDLERAPTRAEAVTMLVRLLGKEDAARAGAWQTPFTDVAAR